jgi:hypothetical protein
MEQQYVSFGVLWTVPISDRSHLGSIAPFANGPTPNVKPEIAGAGDSSSVGAQQGRRASNMD